MCILDDGQCGNTNQRESNGEDIHKERSQNSLSKGTQYYQGFPKLTKSCSYFPVLISRLYRKQLQSIQALVAKVKGTLANG